MTEQAFIMLGCGFLLDGMQGVMHGPLRALGLQGKGSIVGIICYWLIALPLGSLLAFKFDFGLIGLLVGLSTATGC